MKGRNLPHRVMVLSTKRLATMSEAASQMRTKRKSVPTSATAALPDRVGWLELLHIPGAWGRTDAYARGSVPVELEPIDLTMTSSVSAAQRRPARALDRG
jgi:hypothetical protein